MMNYDSFKICGLCFLKYVYMFVSVCSFVHLFFHSFSLLSFSICTPSVIYFIKLLLSSIFISKWIGMNAHLNSCVRVCLREIDVVCDLISRFARRFCSISHYSGSFLLNPRPKKLWLSLSLTHTHLQTNLCAATNTIRSFYYLLIDKDNQ